jgi:hypothetical protein
LLHLNNLNPQSQEIRSDFTIAEHPIYFWKQDTVIESVDQTPLDVSMSLTLTESDRELVINLNDQQTEYTLKLYYDITKETNKPEIKIWDETINSFTHASIINEDDDLQYVQLKLIGDSTIGLFQQEDHDKLDIENKTGYSIFELLLIYISGSLVLGLFAKIIHSLITLKSSQSKISTYWSRYSLFIPQIRTRLIMFIGFALLIVIILIITVSSGVAN